MVISLPDGRSREFFSDIHCDNLVELLALKKKKKRKSVGHPPVTGSLEFLTLRLVHMELPAIQKLQFRFCFLSTGSPEGFCLWVSAQVSTDPLSLPAFLYSFGGSVLSGDVTSLMDPSRVVDFLVSSTFNLLLQWYYDGQAPYMPDQKLKIRDTNTF